MLRDLVDLHHDRGDTVRVVTGTSKDFSADYKREFPDHFEVAAFRADLDRNGGIPRRILISVRLLICCLYHVLFGKKWDLLYTLSYPPLLAWFLIAFGHWSRRVKRSVFYLEDNHVYRVPAGPMRWVYRTVLKSTIAKATCTITLSKEMSDELVSYFPAHRQAEIAAKIALVPNFSPDIGLVDEVFDTFDHDIIYAGNHGKGQNLPTFLEMLAHPELDPKPKVSFFGSGQVKADLVARTRELGLDSFVTFHDPVSRAEAQREMARARFGLVGAIPGLLRFAFPSKLAGYNIVGTPGIVMCDVNGGTAESLRENGFGFAIDPEDVAAGARALREALAQSDDPSVRLATKARGLDVYGKATYLVKMNALLDDLEAGRSLLSQV